MVGRCATMRHLPARAPRHVLDKRIVEVDGKHKGRSGVTRQ